MNTNFTKKLSTLFLTLGLLVFTSQFSQAQGCSSGSTTFYGLSTAGRLSTINVATGAVGPAVHRLTTGSSAENSNGLGYNRLNGKFYYFHRSGASGEDDGGAGTQFVSYDPATSTLSNLSVRNYTSLGRIVRSGCVNNDGTGYYSLDAGDASHAPHLWYYSIAGNSWTDVTSIFKNGTTNYTSTFVDLHSGDMAFDGGGNLWMLLYRSNTYALFKIPAPPKVNTRGGITVEQVIAPTSTASLRLGGSITGFAFNTAGEAFITTAAPSNKIYKMSTATLPTYVASIAVSDMGADLASCSAPMSVLPASFLKFSIDTKKDIELKWNTVEDAGVKGYNIEHSADGHSWRSLAFVAKKAFSNNTSAEYIYLHQQLNAGSNYYRIQQLNHSGTTLSSPVRYVSVKPENRIIVSPDASSNLLYIRTNDDKTKYGAHIFDDQGRLISNSMVNSSYATINISNLQKGYYILRLTTSTDAKTTSYRFFKH